MSDEHDYERDLEMRHDAEDDEAEFERLEREDAERLAESPAALSEDGGEGRRLHPYVAAHPHPDHSARAYRKASGEVMTVARQSHGSRATFHLIEGLLGFLTPSGNAHLACALLHRLNPTKLAEGVPGSGITVEDLDPTGTDRAFESLFEPQLRAALEALEHVTERCPGCGRMHGDVGWVHSATGQSVRVERMTAQRVLFTWEIAPDTWAEPQDWPRARFEAVYVRADTVALLGE